MAAHYDTYDVLFSLQTHTFGSNDYFVETVYDIIIQIILTWEDWELEYGKSLMTLFINKLEFNKVNKIIIDNTLRLM